MTNPNRDCVTKRGLAGSKLDASVLLLAFPLSGLAMAIEWTRISQDTGIKRSHPEE